MADSFFGFDTSFPNLNDDEGGGGPSEDEYDALNDETFGQDSDELDWEVEHEQLAEQLESSRRNHSDIDEANSQLEASLSKLVLDEPDSPRARNSLTSSVWRHDLSFPTAPTPAPTLKNVCTVEELERQLRQSQATQQQGGFTGQNFYQPRFPPVILQRPLGLQAPVPLPYAPQQSTSHGVNQMNQSINKIIGPTVQIKQMGQGNQLFSNQMCTQNVNQMGQNLNQMNQNNPFVQNNQLGPQFKNNPIGQGMVNQMPHNMQNVYPMSQTNQMLQNQMGQNINQMMTMNQNLGQKGQNMNQMGQGINQISQNNQIGQNVNSLGQNMNQINQNQIIPNGGQFGPGMNQYPHMMGQPRMIAPPPGMGMPRQNFSPSMNQFNPNFRGPTPPTNKGIEQSMNQNLVMNQHLKNQTQQINQMKPMMNSPQMSSQQVNAQHMHSQQINSQQMNQMNHSQMNHSQMNHSQMNHPQMNPQQMNIQQMNTQHMNTQQMNNQQINTQQMNTQQMNTQQMNIQQMNTQQLNTQQMNTQQMNTQQMNTPLMNNQQMNTQLMNNQQLNNQHLTTHQINSLQNKPSQTVNAKPAVNQRTESTQKTRAYSNTNTNKVMSSQNLAKFLIQNTYPVLPLNSYHNASHHPMLNNRSTVFNNSQILNNHPMFSGQRPNGMFNNGNRHIMNGDDTGDAVEVDDYAGLMTQREKQWLINIQMLQLNTGTPYIHDFYYTVFLERQANKEKEGVKEAHKANQQNHPFYSGAVKHEQQPRERHNSHRHNSTSEDGAAPRAYVPTQFENSLGKLQCGSVTAPRKIIDVEVVAAEPPSTRVSRAPSVASTTNPAEVPREVKRTKQLLIDIEALYLILLRLEELNDPLAISNALILKEREEKQKQLEAEQKEALENEPEEDTNLFLRNIESVQRRPKQESPKSESIDKRQVVNLAVSQKPAPVKNLLDEDKDDLLNKLFAGLLHSDRLPQMLTVRKGRVLVARFAARAPCTHVRMRALWSRVLRALPHAARRDDGGLAALAHHYRRYIQSTNGWSAVLESCGILSEAIDPARTHHALTTALTLSCVCAMLEKATLLVNTPEATSSERQWFKFLKSLARALKNTTLTVAKPVQPLPESKVVHHLKQLDSRSTIEILQRGKTTTEFADLTKGDISEQLIKHLC